MRNRLNFGQSFPGKGVAFYHPDLVVGEAVPLVHQRVDLALQPGLIMGRLGGGQTKSCITKQGVFPAAPHVAAKKAALHSR